MDQLVAERHNRYRSADPIGFRSNHRRLAWFLRLSVIMNVVMTVAFGIAVSGFAAVIPLKEVRVALVRTADDDDRIYRIEPIEQGVESFDIVMETSARRFVKLLLEIDDVTQKARFDEAFLLMDPDFRKDWLKIHEERIKKALKDGLEREIILETTHRQDQRPGEWLITVDFKQIDKIKGEVKSNEPLRAYVRLATRINRIKKSEIYMNPLGISVLDMTIKQRGESQ